MRYMQTAFHGPLFWIVCLLEYFRSKCPPPEKYYDITMYHRFHQRLLSPPPALSLHPSCMLYTTCDIDETSRLYSLLLQLFELKKDKREDLGAKHPTFILYRITTPLYHPNALQIHLYNCVCERVFVLFIRVALVTRFVVDSACYRI